MYEAKFSIDNKTKIQWEVSESQSFDLTLS